MTEPRYTYDGLPIAPDEPHGATVVVRRRTAGPAGAGTGPNEYLVLHRAHHGPDYDGDWAWTPPAGSRQPGEPVLAAALRELAEEAGLEPAPAELRALDLSGAWVRFGLDVAADAQARLIDAEHDRFEWVPAAVAIARCQPAAVSGSVRLAESVLAPQLSFRPLEEGDVPALLEWQRAPHVAQWFREQPDLGQALRKYRPRMAGQSPTRMHIALVDGQAAGFLQHYRIGDYPDYAAVTGVPDAVGVDYAIGAAGLTGRGLGPQLIWAYLRDVVRPAHPAAVQAAASPDVANHRSVRALEKAGFSQAGRIVVPGEPAPEQLCVLDLVKFFGNVAAPG